MEHLLCRFFKNIINKCNYYITSLYLCICLRLCDKNSRKLKNEYKAKI